MMQITHVSSDGSDESAQILRLVKALTACTLNVGTRLKVQAKFEVSSSFSYI